MDLKMFFSDRLKKARQKRGYTQDRLSDLAGINKKVISKYEQGVILPGTDNLQKLVLALEISADYFLLPHATLVGIPMVKDPILYEKYFVLEALDTKEKEAALMLLNSLIAQQRLKELVQS